MSTARSSRPGPARGAAWEAPPRRRARPLPRVGRLPLSRRAAASVLGLSLLALFGAPLIFGANTTIAPARATAIVAPNLAPTIDCADPAERLDNPGSCPRPPASSSRSMPSAPTPTSTTSAPRAASDPHPNPELCAIPDAPPDCPPRDPGPASEECRDEEGCLPNPTSTTPSPDGKPHKPKPAEPADECGITDPIACVTEGIDAVFRGIVTSALNPLLKFLSETLLTTPTLDDLPQVGPLWGNSWQLALACYATFILVGGLIVMGHETLQSSYTAKEIAPRLVVGFLAGFLSLFAAEQMIRIANSLSGALLSEGLDADSAGSALRDMVMGAITGGGLFLLLMGLALAVMLVALLITYVVRVAFTVILLIGAPLALMCHALPHTEGIAKWWWKALAGVLAIQVAQSLTLIVALKVFFSPSGWTPFGPKPTGLINLLVALALIFVLLKIPFWIMSATRAGGGRSFAGSLVKGFVAYKTLGLIKGTTASGGGAVTATRAAATRTTGSSTSTTASGNLGPGGRRPPRRPPAPGSGSPPQPPTPPTPVGGPRTPKPDRPYTPSPSSPAPPIEHTEWGQGRTSNDTRSAHHPAPRGRAPSSGFPTGPLTGRDSAAVVPRPDRVRRAHDAARRAWQPVPGARPATGAASVAPPIEDTPAGRGGHAAAPPAPPGRRANPPSGASSRAAERFAQRPPPQTPVSRLRPQAPRSAPSGKRVPLDLPGSHNPTPVKPARPPRPPRPPQSRRSGGSS